MEKKGWTLEGTTAAPRVVGVDPANFDTILRQHIAEGWLDLGYAGWSGYGQAGSADDAKRQALKVGAQMVLLSSELLGTSSYANTYHTVRAAFLVKSRGRASFGVYTRKMTPEDQKTAGTVQGLAVDVVILDSPAAESGIVPDDIITHIGDIQMISEDSLRRALDELQGTTVTIRLIRQGNQLERTVALGTTRPTSAP